jgi:signal transduction histidine kinase
MVKAMKTHLFSPWRSMRTWNALTFLALNAFSWIGFAVTITLLALSIGLAITYPLATPFIFLLFSFAGLTAKLERSRVRALLGVDIGAARTKPLTGSWWNRIGQMLKSPIRWKHVAYALIAPFKGTCMMVVAIHLWAGSLLLIVLPVIVPFLPNDSAEFGLFNVGFGASAFGFSLLGLIGFFIIAPWVTIGFGNFSALFAKWLLGPGDESLREEVESLKESRSVAATIAETERQRIERDLHDGAQQRLVALAMDLGRAETQFDNDPVAARALLASAREEAAAALTELRDLVRGVHPAILSDRGLDAALSAVVARSSIPVELDVRVTSRPPAPVESAAYFIVTEALMNAIKHSGATSVHIDIVRTGDTLSISVSDNGAGGADPTKGTGLQGLRDRVTALGGWMQLISPAGGPTSVMVELSCA